MDTGKSVATVSLCAMGSFIVYVIPESVILVFMFITLWMFLIWA